MGNLGGMIWKYMSFDNLIDQLPFILEIQSKWARKGWVCKFATKELGNSDYLMHEISGKELKDWIGEHKP